MNKRLLTILFALAALCTGALSVYAGSDTARVRAIHASPGAPTVDICANGEIVFPGVSFGDATDYATLPLGTYQLTVVAAGAGCDSTPIISQQVPLLASGDFSVVASNVLPNVEPLVGIDDNTLPLSGMAKVRFWHLSPNAPAVDVWAGETCAAPSLPLFVDTEFQAVADEGYVSVPAGTYTLSVCPTGTEAVALSVPNVTVDSDTVYSALALGLVDGKGRALEAKLIVDAVGTELSIDMSSQEAFAPAPTLLLSLVLLVGVSLAVGLRQRSNTL